MIVTDLIMELAKMPPELQVIYQLSDDEKGFKMVVVEDLDEVITDGDEHYILLNANSLGEEEDDDDEIL
jgi:hypothetical protein